MTKIMKHKELISTGLSAFCGLIVLAGPDPEAALLSGLKDSVAKSLLLRLIRLFI
jgi:hypothetical protein